MLLLKKMTPFFVFMAGVHLPHGQSTLGGNKIFTKFYCNTKFNFLINFNVVLSNSK